MNSLIRVCCISNRVFPMQPKRCLQTLLPVLDHVKADAPDLIVLPQFALTGISCGSFFQNPALLDGARQALDQLAASLRDFDGFTVVGLAVGESGRSCGACAVLQGGALLGFFPTPDPPAGLEPAPPELFFSAGTLFGRGDIRFLVVPCQPEHLMDHAELIASSGCDLVVVPAAAPASLGSLERAEEAARAVSRGLGVAVAVACGGAGETSSPSLYRSFGGVWEQGHCLAFCSQDNGDFLSPAEVAVSDIDADIIRAGKRSRVCRTPDFASSVPSPGHRGFLRGISPTPFLPEENTAAALDELFSLQTAALMARLQNTGLRKMVLGLSGGLDSTLALLVAAKTADCLHLSRKNIVAVTMPGFGTSDRTYFNALALIEALGCDGRDISIRDSIVQHFEDIGHNIAVHDSTYENAQARERTQILFDLANSEKALVLGTGDLSEAALGWCTFGGDHLAGYNVNISLPKTVIRALTSRLCDVSPDPSLQDTLRDILDTPVSPELLPPQENGAIGQKTEELLGPYELHDFFLFYLLRYHFRPSKIFYYACTAFSGKYETELIKEKLLLFFQRLAAGQFKRSAAPDGARLWAGTFFPADFWMPSDGELSELAEELDAIDF
ncbi:MAG: NAD(+) synthase [Oscillospiraceae bacterium]|nr:NAD(+) synthase [Oscillospiraceae bacterium]